MIEVINSKKIGIMQPYFMPYLGYWQHINAVDIYVLYDDVNFIKRGWINRNRILNEGREYLFTLPLSKVSQNKLICEHEFVDNNGKKQLWRVLENAYKKAPERESANNLLQKVVLCPELKLVDYIYNATIEICNYLDIKTNILLSSQINNNKELKGQYKILDICKLLDGDVYVNPSGGVELYDDDFFHSNGVELKFIVPQLNEYNQLAKEFVPGLSIVDMLYSIPRQEIINRLTECKIVSKNEM